MKRNFILAAGAFCFAIGGAIASSLALTDVRVHARQIEDGPIVCVNTGKQCESTGNAACTIIVPTTKAGTGGSQTASSGGTFNAYGDAACSIQLQNSSATSQNSSVSVYELRP